MVLCVVHGVVLSAWHVTVTFLLCEVCGVVLSVVQQRGMVLCVVRGVVRHLEQQQNPNELRLLTHTNDKVWKI